MKTFVPTSDASGVYDVQSYPALSIARDSAGSSGFMGYADAARPVDTAAEVAEIRYIELKAYTGGRLAVVR